MNSAPFTPRFAASALERWTAKVFAACGASDEDASLTASVLVRTNLRGIDTHGVMRVPQYVEKLRSGEVNPRASAKHEFENGVLTVDGDSGLGQAVATRAVRHAAELAKDMPVVPAFIRRSGHLAAIGQFALAGAELGAVTIICQETPPLMALLGSRGPAIGNNPIAFAIPLRGRAPIVFDMATSVVARGNVLQAARDKAVLPDGWAIGPDGEVTTDPAVALKGAMLPVAGPKGVGLAMLVQVLAGTLTGSIAAQSAKAHGAMSSAGNVGAFVLLLNPDLLIGREAFDTHVEEWVSAYLDASGPEARYPGQRAAESERERAVSGIPVSESLRDDLTKVGDLVGVPFELAPIAD